MFFPFLCESCKKDKWSIRYDSKANVHIIICANCGSTEVLEDIFGSRRKKKNGRSQKKVKPNREEVVEASKEPREVIQEANQVESFGQVPEEVS